MQQRTENSRSTVLTVFVTVYSHQRDKEVQQSRFVCTLVDKATLAYRCLEHVVKGGANRLSFACCRRLEDGARVFGLAA